MSLNRLDNVRVVSQEVISFGDDVDPWGSIDRAMRMHDEAFAQMMADIEHERRQRSWWWKVRDWLFDRLP